MSRAIARILTSLALFVLVCAGLVGSSWAQYLTPGTLQVGRVQYDGNTNSGSNYVSPYSFPEIFNDQAGCSTGNSICDIAGIEGSIYIDQFNAEPGTAVQNSLSLPSTGTPVTTYPSPEPGSYITTSFSSKSEGSLNLSSDGTSLTYMGYQANDQLSDVSNNYSLNPFYQLSPNTYTQDPSAGTPVTITAATYTNSNGNTTITLSSPVTLPAGSFFTIAGMNAGGYNGFYATTAAVTNSTTLAFSLKKSLSLANCTSSATCGGTALYDPPYGFYDREVALINSTGLVSLTPIDNANSGDNPRGALTVDEQEFYTFGNSDSTLSGETLTPGVAVVPPTGPNNPGLTIGIRCGIPEQNFSYLLGTYFASDRSDETAKKHVKDNNWRGGAIATDANGNQQLYVSKGSGGNGDDGVFLVQDPNTGVLPVCSLSEPDNNTATITPVFSAQATVPGGQGYQTSPYLPFGFWFANPTTLYVADEGNPPTYVGGTNNFIDADAGTFTLPQLANGSYAADPYAGLEKWVYSNGSWSLAYTIQAGLNMYQPQSVAGYLDTTGQPINSYTYGLRNMAGVNNNDGSVTIYAITSQFSSVSGGESDPDSLVGITDSLAATSLPANEQFTTLQTSAPGELFRGVAYIPTGNARSTQTITFPNPGPVSYGSVSTLTLSASATSNWPIAYTLISGPATLSGNVLTITGAGNIVVQADQSGNTDYSAAASVQDTIVVNPQATTVSWATPAPITYGTPLSGIQLNATASVAGSFVYTPAAGTVLTAGIQTLSVSFTPSSSNYAPSTGSVYLQVNQAATTTSWATPAAITYGTPLSGTQLDATASVPGSFAYTPAAGTVLNAGSQTLSVVFTPTDSVDYTPSSASVKLTVNKASQTITFTTPAPSQAVYGTSFTVVASASSGLAVNYSNAGSCTNSGGTYTMDSGIGECSVYANQPGSGNYLAAAPVSEVVVAEKANPSVSFTGAPANAAYGSTFTLIATTNASTSAVITGTNAATCSLSGSSSPVTVTILKGSGSCTFTATWAADNNYVAASTKTITSAEKATPVITWATPASIPAGTALSGTQLDASANVAGSFAYSPAAGTVLSAGTHTLSVTFTPNDTADYATAKASVSLQVNATTITWAAPAAITYPTPLSTAQLNATANVSGTFAYSVAGVPVAVGTVLSAGKQTLTVNFTPNDTVNYGPATASVTLTVNKATPTVTWATPAAIIYGTPLSATQLDAVAYVAGTSTPVAGNFTYAPASGAVENTGNITLHATFVSGDSNYSNVSGTTVTLQVLETATTTTITSSSKTVTLNASGVATAHLDFNVTSYKPMGAVTLTASTGETCSGSVVAATGNGSCTLTFTTTGTRTILASYGGDTNHRSSNSSAQSPAITVTVNQ